MNPFMMMMFLRLAQKVNELPVKPPVTIGLMGLMAMLHFNPGAGFGGQISRFGVQDVCVSPYEVFVRADVSRIVLAALYHADDYHLYYNLSSFLAKGVALEMRLGSPLMAAMTGFLLVCSHLIYLVLAVAMDDFMTCVVGFSAVLFALKVIVTYDLQDPNADAFFYGIRLPSKHIVWAEILFIHLVVPRSSLLGHISGALAGFGFLALRKVAPYWLSWIPREPPRTYGQGTWGGENRAPPQPPRNENYFPQPGAANFEPRYNPPPSNRGVSAEELRRRRMNRFQQES